MNARFQGIVILLFAVLTWTCPLSGLPSSAKAALTRPPILGVAHMAYYVSNLQQARGWYQDYLGFDQAFAGKSADGAPVVYYKINDHQYIILYCEAPKNHGYIHDIAFQTTDVGAMRAYLASCGVRVGPISKDPSGDRYCALTGPFGFQVRFVQYLPGSATGRGEGQFMPATRAATKVDHVGIMIQNRSVAEKFYGGILGFTPDQGPKVTKMTIGAGPDRFELGFGRVMTPARFHIKNHICLSVPNVPALVARLDAKPISKQFRTIETHVLSNGKHVAELYGPDDNRIELMEPPKGASAAAARSVEEGR